MTPAALLAARAADLGLVIQKERNQIYNSWWVGLRDHVNLQLAWSRGQFPTESACDEAVSRKLEEMEKG